MRRYEEGFFDGKSLRTYQINERAAPPRDCDPQGLFLGAKDAFSARRRENGVRLSLAHPLFHTLEIRRALTIYLLYLTRACSSVPARAGLRHVS